MTLEGKVALVTGGGRGIGLGCSKALAAKGADIALTYRKNKESAEEGAREIEALGHKALAIQCDQTDEDQVNAAVAKTIEELGKIDILVCNAGVASRGNMVHDTTTKEMRLVMDTHVMGSFWFCRAATGSMREQGEGYIVLISSVATLAHGARGAPYSMAKSAMESLGKTLSKEEGPNGIRVNIVGPGLVETEMGRRLMKARTGKPLDELRADYPFGKICQPEDIGNAVAFLCSPEGSYISGQVLYVHGGGFIRNPASEPV